MIRHVVLVRFREAVPATEITAIFQQLDDLRAKLPGLKAFHGGPNVSPEGCLAGSPMRSRPILSMPRRGTPTWLIPITRRPAPVWSRPRRAAWVA